MPVFHARSGYFIATAVLLTVACGGAPSEPNARPAALDTLPRSLSPSETKIIGAANDFSFSLFRSVSSSPDTNVFTSPLSASFALGMTMNGAAGATYDQMRSALAFGGMTEGEINDGYRSLIALLRGLDPQVDFRIANSIWHHEAFPVAPSFVDLSRTHFGAEVRALNFASPASVKTINDWVSEATAQKIPTIVEQLDRDLVMLLINAIYFKGSWRDRFDPALTQDAPFHGVAGDQHAKLMRRDGTMRYLGTADFEAVDLPYGNGAFTMTVLLPRTGRSVESVAASLQPASWSAWMGQFRETNVDLHLPRFKLEWSRRLNDDLRSLGMRDAFDEGIANFARLSPMANGVFVSYVQQKTYVDVNEEGTEAAAVTAVGVSVTSAPQTVVVRVDRPFLFVIRERLSGTVLFMGKIVRLPD